MYNTAINKGLDMGATMLLGGGVGKGLVSLARPYVPYALARLSATRYGKPIADGINRFANSPVGKFAGKIVDFIF